MADQLADDLSGATDRDHEDFSVPEHGKVFVIMTRQRGDRLPHTMRA
jgi:hypothetical protein